MLAVLSGLYRRLLGGWLDNIPVIKERGIQWLLCALLYAPCIWFFDYNTWLAEVLPEWLFVLLSTFLLILAETTGHFPAFKCGTESMEYINSEIERGRKIPYKRICDWIAKKRGFECFGREWCFCQLVLCKTVYLIPVVFLLGCQFVFVGFCVAFAYNACYWIEFKDCKKVMTSPTNWGEFFQGALYMYGIILGGL